MRRFWRLNRRQWGLLQGRDRAVGIAGGGGVSVRSNGQLLLLHIHEHEFGAQLLRRSCVKLQRRLAWSSIAV